MAGGAPRRRWSYRAGPMRPLRLCLVDMNNGVPNEATRCFKVLSLGGFVARARGANPGLEFLDRPRAAAKSGRGSPGRLRSPGAMHRRPQVTLRWIRRPMVHGLPSVVPGRGGRDAQASGRKSPSALVVCHSFEIAIQHFGFARMKLAARLQVRNHAGVHDQGRRSVRPFSGRSANGSSSGSTATGRPLS